MKIMVIGINYAPEPTGSAPYTTGLAEILTGQGHLVKAVVGIPHYPSWTVMPQDRFVLRRNETINGVEVNHFRHFVPKRQSAFRRAVWELTFLFNVLAHRNKFRPDIIFSSTPSLSGGLLGVFFASKYRVPLVTVVQDLVGQGVIQSGLSKGKRIEKFIVNLENHIFSASKIVAIVSPSFNDYVRRSGVLQKSIFEFPNWSHIEKPTKNMLEARNSFGWSQESFIILHTGNMGLKQNLENVIETAKLFENEKRFLFVICGDGSQKERLVKAGAEVKQLVFLDPVSETDYPNLLVAADVVLVNERSTVGDMSLPSKLTSYLFAGKPILAAVDPKGACSRELKKTEGAGIIVPANDVEALASAVRNLARNTTQLEVMSKLSLAYSLRYLSEGTAKSNVKKIVTMVTESKN